jgi:hypothetical protein
MVTRGLVVENLPILKVVHVKVEEIVSILTKKLTLG